MSKLRNYQHRAIQDIYGEWQAGRRQVLLSMPTGSGKTRTFSEIVKHFCDRGEQSLVLAHREELLMQSQKTLEKITGQPVGTIKAGQPLNLDLLIQCASVQTLVKRLEQRQFQLLDVKLVIVDEAHLSLAPSYLKILTYFPDAYILGVTATPCRLDGQGFQEVYQSLVLGPDTHELISWGFLADYDVLAPESFLPQEGIRITGGDFNQGDLAEQIDRRYVAGQAVSTYQQYALGRQCVTFAINIEHSKAIALGYQEAGIPAEHIDGDTPAKDRLATLDRFRKGATKVLTNVNLFTEGFDMPEIEVVQLCRPTQSVALHLQMIGRGLRPKNGNKALILDHAGNCLRLGAAKAMRYWSLEGIVNEPFIEDFVEEDWPAIAVPEMPEKRIVEIFETNVVMSQIPNTKELETHLANASYREPRSLRPNSLANHKEIQMPVLPRTAPRPVLPSSADDEFYQQSYNERSQLYSSSQLSNDASQGYSRTPSNSPRRPSQNSQSREVIRRSDLGSPESRPRQAPQRRRAKPVQPRKSGIVRQIGKAALELATLLDSILDWVWKVWFKPEPKKKRPSEYPRSRQPQPRQRQPVKR
ncbi:DEAD/DEAH box helicase [Tumidithrix elongata RA019]|uniref:DEAD/DEAH box helicase n=1 Tax=Tumidithrix elongata BACA0141 TaxID=2716417 RepID=A0AAW9PUG7_9CYAN|nr:DEAD/DEAH box helicase [Tumidithrix elongata RA019]